MEKLLSAKGRKHLTNSQFNLLHWVVLSIKREEGKVCATLTQRNGGLKSTHFLKALLKTQLLIAPTTYLGFLEPEARYIFKRSTPPTFPLYIYNANLCKEATPFQIFQPNERCPCCD